MSAKRTVNEAENENENERKERGVASFEHHS